MLLTEYFGITRTAEKIKGINKTYTLLRDLSSINGSEISGQLLDRTMFSFETLPPLGKEYWWFIFFGRDLRQMMLLMFRKFGRNMIFNSEKVEFKIIDQSIFQAVTAGWIYDGSRILDLGVNNPKTVVNQKEKEIITQISDRNMTLKGGFPEYELKIDGFVNMKMTKGDFLENKCAHGVFIPPFGTGWIDIYSNAEGDMFGREFDGTAHLQKVVGVMPYGPFQWARVIFKNGSTFSFFCLKTGKRSKIYFHNSMNFYDHESKKYLRFKKPKLKITKEIDDTTMWTVKGQDEDNELTIVLKVYAEQRFAMRGGGTQVYIEYAVTPIEFSFRNKDEKIILDDLGEGVGTLEDAYGSPIF